jgi:chromosome segregation ATPase
MVNSRSILPKDGLQPRLSDAEIRKLVHSKDTALAKILEEHESEMNMMATNMEELRMKEARIQAALKKRKKRTRLAVVLGAILTICGGVGMEYYRQEQVAREITMGREAERAADAETIRKLKAEVKTLSSKLQDAEATIRYEESRYESIKASSTKTTKELEAMQVKWLMDQGELEKCRVQRKELDGDLSKLTAKHESVSEEVVWCRERLESTERAMEGMERALKAKNDVVVHGGHAPTLKEITKSIDAEADAAEKKKDGKNNKPVQMEMKYNKSFRNAVLLRQLYSAVGGMVASVLAQGLMPAIGRIVSMMFLGV